MSKLHGASGVCSYLSKPLRAAIRESAPHSSQALCGAGLQGGQAGGSSLGGAGRCPLVRAEGSRGFGHKSYRSGSTNAVIGCVVIIQGAPVELLEIGEHRGYVLPGRQSKQTSVKEHGTI